MPEHLLRTHFSNYGTLRSLVCSHRAHCAFVNYATRSAAEAAAAAAADVGGRVIVAGVPLRVQWGKMRALDSMENEERGKNAREGRDVDRVLKEVGAGSRQEQQAGSSNQGAGATAGTGPEKEDLDALAEMTRAPPGQEGGEGEKYAALSGE